MKINILKSSIPLMLYTIKKIKDNEISRRDIGLLLEHPDYEIEFKRYEDRINKDEFIDYLLKVEKLSEKEIDNKDLKAHHGYYQDIFKHYDDYVGKLKELDRFKKDVFEKQVETALEGLPEGFEFSELNFLFTIGIGQSFGYVYKNYMHFDYLQLIKNKSIDEFLATLAHEIHHVGLSQFLGDVDEKSMPLEDLFYLYFSGEGLAVKYCNNAEGILSKSISNGSKNIGLDEFTWDYLNNDFENTMKTFKKTVSDIRSGKINTLSQLQQQLKGYWMNPYLEDQSKDDIPKLQHFRLYSFGNEIWGMIHDVFGKEKVYETMKNIKDFPKVYNAALQQIGKDEYKIC